MGKDEKLELKNESGITFLYSFVFQNNDSTILVTEVNSGTGDIWNKQ